MDNVVGEYGTTVSVITVLDMPDSDEVEEPEMMRSENGLLLVSGSVEVYELN